MTTSVSAVRVYIACSLDGFIAGPGGDLSWLPGASEGDEAPVRCDDGAIGYDAFMANVGALLMGRATYDAVLGFGVPWPYGERPVLVATHRALDPVAPTVRATTGDIAELVAEAKAAAAGRDVYLDGGALIRQALDAALIDDLIVTMVPVVLGDGHALFAGAQKRHTFDLVGHYRYGTMLQIHARPA